MPKIPCINHEEARELLDSGEAIFVDVRDPMSHQEAHIPGCIHLTMQTMEDFLEKTSHDATLIVYCYHGNSSLGATDYLMERGFKNVRSLNGGFESWRALHDDRVEHGATSS